MYEESDRETYRALVEAKLQPGRIRSTLAFAGLYQITHELIKESVMTELRNFFFAGIDETGILIDEQRYAAEVLALDPKKRTMRASLRWLVNAQAITEAQADRLDDIYDHRHDLTHELAKYVVDPAHEPDVRLFTDALNILRDVLRYWTVVEIEREVSRNTGKSAPRTSCRDGYCCCRRASTRIWKGFPRRVDTGHRARRRPGDVPTSPRAAVRDSARPRGRRRGWPIG